MKKFLLNNRGFTLVELIVASALLVIVLVPLFTTLTESYMHLRMTDDYHKATFFLQQKAEELRSSSFDGLSNQNFTSYQGSKYDLIQTVTDVEDMKDSDNNIVIKKVVLEIKKGDRLLGEMEFLIYKDGI